MELLRETIFFNRTIGRDGYPRPNASLRRRRARRGKIRATSADQRVGALDEIRRNSIGRARSTSLDACCRSICPRRLVRVKTRRGTPESTLFAYLVVTLKFLYGLDGGRRRQAPPERWVGQREEE